MCTEKVGQKELYFGTEVILANMCNAVMKRSSSGLEEIILKKYSLCFFYLTFPSVKTCTIIQRQIKINGGSMILQL